MTTSANTSLPGLTRKDTNESIDPRTLGAPSSAVRRKRRSSKPQQQAHANDPNIITTTANTGISSESYSSSSISSISSIINDTNHSNDNDSFTSDASRWNNESVKFSAKNFVRSNRFSETTANTSTKSTPSSSSSSSSSSLLESHYRLNKLIGEGGFGEVYSCQHLATKENRAVKVMEKSFGSSTKHEQSINESIMREYNILRELDHPNILKVYEMYETKHHFFIVTDLYSGGDLFSELEDFGVFDDDDAADLMNTMLTCMNYCHQRGLVHLDLKPENVLLPGRQQQQQQQQKGYRDFTNVKIIDFGLAQYQDDNKKLTSLEGSSYYMSPQVVKRCYKGDKADVWSCGVVCHVMMTGYAPFDGPKYKDILKAIVEGKFHLNDPEWDDATEEAKDFITYCLTYNEDERPSAYDALQHPFLKNMRQRRSRSRSDSRQHKLARESLQNLIAFSSGHSKLKQATCAIMASQLLNQDEKDEIDAVFRSFDTSCNGQLSKEDLKRCHELYFEQVLSDEDVDKIFEQVNFSCSGNIEYSEFTIAIMMSQNMVDDAKLKAAYKIFDSGDKGFISSDDIKRVLHLDDQHDEYLRKKILRQVDAEESGRISFEEFKKIMQSSASLRKQKVRHGKAMAVQRTPRRTSFSSSVSSSMEVKVDMNELLNASLVSSMDRGGDADAHPHHQRQLSGSSNAIHHTPITFTSLGNQLNDLQEGEHEDYSSGADLSSDSDLSDSDDEDN